MIFEKCEIINKRGEEIRLFFVKNFLLFLIKIYYFDVIMIAKGYKEYKEKEMPTNYISQDFKIIGGLKRQFIIFYNTTRGVKKEYRKEVNETLNRFRRCINLTTLANTEKYDIEKRFLMQMEGFHLVEELILNIVLFIDMHKAKIEFCKMKTLQNIHLELNKQRNAYRKWVVGDIERNEKELRKRQIRLKNTIVENENREDVIIGLLHTYEINERLKVKMQETYYKLTTEQFDRVKNQRSKEEIEKKMETIIKRYERHLERLEEK